MGVALVGSEEDAYDFLYDHEHYRRALLPLLVPVPQNTRSCCLLSPECCSSDPAKKKQKRKNVIWRRKNNTVVGSEEDAYDFLYGHEHYRRALLPLLAPVLQNTRSCCLLSPECCSSDAAKKNRKEKT